MGLRDAAQIIRDTVSMDSILGLYGYQPKHGFLCCPFHGEKEPSLKIYSGGRGWHCFGCGRGGSVIDFVMEHEGCNFGTAVKAIDEALGLDLLKPGDPLSEDRRRALAAILDDAEKAFLQSISRQERIIECSLRVMAKKQQALESIRKADRSADDWTALHALTEEMQYSEYRLARCGELREEVRAWRRQSRRSRQGSGALSA